VESGAQAGACFRKRRESMAPGEADGVPRGSEPQMRVRARDVPCGLKGDQVLLCKQLPMLDCEIPRLGTGVQDLGQKRS